MCHERLQSCYFLPPVRSDYLGKVYRHVRTPVIFHLSLSVSCPLLLFSHSSCSVFLVTVYPVEGSGKTNRLSLPCGFSYSSSCNHLSLPRFHTFALHFRSLSIFLHPVDLPLLLTCFLNTLCSCHLPLTLLFCNPLLSSLFSPLLPSPLFLPLKPQEPSLLSHKYHH